jgi:Lactoylglutathione lyase and related lyases
MEFKFAYVGIRVIDLDKSIDFYTNILNMKLLRRHAIKETDGEIAVLESGGSLIELNYYSKKSRFYTEYTPGEELDHLAFQVKNLDSAVEELNKKGYPIELEIRSGRSRWIYIKDPNGIWIELFE